uniref:Retrovirus-related Pol polyprotein from transposon TNT 1-94 n=1 Tax=Cajanus cajan TaxID=3821 RepID=A0A151RP10_CAJCA|nr:Retrovirus-related Pol polyprotein from transposon TNT 1-94 [Cajanus cajan]
MTTHLEALDLWEPIEEDYAVHPLLENPTVAQLKNHKERKTRKAKAKACLFSSVSKIIFTRIMNLNSAKDIWNYLKSEYQGSEQTKGMKALNLAREFEMQSMKETETIKSYANKLLSIANKVRLLGKDFSDERIVQKILVTVPEKYESKILALEESKDLSNITLGELVNALQAQEQRRMMRHEEAVQESSNNQQNDTFPPFPHCKKTNHSKKNTIQSAEQKTPFEGWFGYKPYLQNLKIFGCLCFSFVPQVKRDKLDKKAEPGVFIGYNNTSKAYRIFQPQNGKILVSRDVKFMEEKQWSWEELIKKQLQKIPQFVDDDIDNFPVRGTRLLSEIYEKSNVVVLEPSDFKEAEMDDKWIEAMKEELKMIEKNDTWELVDRPQHKQPIGVKWVYRTKLNTDGSINKYKARLVVKGYAQVFGVDFSETFAPVARLDTIGMLLALTAQKGWKVYHLDVKYAFLNGYLQEEIFVEQPEGFQVKGQEEKVYKLKKALYGLKQAPRAWYSRIDDYLQNLGFIKSPSEATLYVKMMDTNLIIVSVYVDDLLVIGNEEKLIMEFKAEML